MNILFIVAHPDDEAYGPFGTIQKLRKAGNEVTIFCLCNGERPTAEHVAQQRQKAFKLNCENVGAKYKVWDNPDLSLQLNETANILTREIIDGEYEIVYAQNRSDINHDHQIVGEASIIACRPKPDCSVKQLYFFEVPASTEWTFGKIEPPFVANHYEEIDEEDMFEKIKALKHYETETYNFPDARSVEAVITLAKYRGYQVGLNYAEAFQLVFSRSRKTL